MNPTLETIAYSHRSSAAHLLTAKATKLSDLLSTEPARSPKEVACIQAAAAFFDMALILMKPYDPNYTTTINWKCLALVKLGQFEEAVNWYREIIRVTSEVDGSGTDPTMRLAIDQIERFKDRRNEPIAIRAEYDASTFDEPPFCRFGQDFCGLLLASKGKKAHANLSVELQRTMSVAELMSAWKSLVKEAACNLVDITLCQQMTDWPTRKPSEVGWCYFSLSGEGLNEGIAIVIGKTERNTYCVNEIEFGRP